MYLLSMHVTWKERAPCKEGFVCCALQNIIVMELCEGGSLRAALDRDSGLRQPREFGW